MENNEFFDKGIEETNSKIRIEIDKKKLVEKEIKKLKIELKRKERAKSIYFGEKKKKAKSEINKQGVI